MGFPFNARKRFPNVAFSATDADLHAWATAKWSSGPIQDIVMVLSGRPAGLAVE